MGDFDEIFDFVIVGSGAGSMVAGLLMRSIGKKVLILEKAALIGGSTSRSGGVMWIPNNPFMARDGVDALVLGREANARIVADTTRLWLAGTRPFAPGCVVVRTTGAVHVLANTDDAVPGGFPKECLFGITWNPDKLVAALAAMLLEPVLISSQRETVKSHLAIILDDSESMKFSDPYTDQSKAAEIASRMKLESAGGRSSVERLRETVDQAGSGKAASVAMANLAEAIQGLVHHMRTEQQLIRDWVDSQAEQQREIKKLLEVMVREKVNR